MTSSQFYAHHLRVTVCACKSREICSVYDIVDITKFPAKTEMLVQHVTSLSNFQWSKLNLLSFKSNIK